MLCLLHAGLLQPSLLQPSLLHPGVLQPSFLHACSCSWPCRSHARLPGPASAVYEGMRGIDGAGSMYAEAAPAPAEDGKGGVALPA